MDLAVDGFSCVLHGIYYILRHDYHAIKLS